MTIFKFILRSIAHYRRQHLALFLGTTITAAVLTGALIVGDSIKYSLFRMVDTRLGKTQIAVIGGARFLDNQLAEKLSHALDATVSPILLLRGIAIDPNTGTRINQVGILGIDSSFNGISTSPMEIPGEDEAVISENLAERLHLKAGDMLVVRVENANTIPVNAPFAKEPAPSVALRLTIKAIASDDQLGKFNLGNDQLNVYNVFVSNSHLNKRLELDERSNTFLIAGGKDKILATAVADSIQKFWTLKDLGLSTRNGKINETYDLVSERIFIDTVVQKIIIQKNLPHKQIITYLVNDIKIGGKSTPYSFASAVPESLAGQKLNSNEVLINEWTARDLNAKAGDSVTLTWYEIGPFRELRETGKAFLVKDIVSNNTAHIDSMLMPKFPGLSGTGNCRDWDAGVPIDLKRIRDKDEKYWDDYRGTPKVLLSIETGEKLWKNKFGMLTSIRFNNNQVSQDELTETLLNTIGVTDIGILVIDLKKEGAAAAENAVNFTELFLGLSFFVILAGVLLTTLIYSLHFSRRKAETALLSGLGFSPKRIIRLRFAEASLVILTGSIAGALLGILYNHVLITALNTIWNDIVRTNMLWVKVNPASLLMGAAVSMLVAALPVYRMTRKSLKQPVAGQLKENAETTVHKTKSGKKSRVHVFGIASLATAFGLVLYSFIASELDNPILYLLSAALFLTGILMLTSRFLRAKQSAKQNVPSFNTLAIKNLQRNPSRSMAVIALLAIGTFTIVLTGSYRKTFYGTENLRNSGTGGYLLWAETTSPVPFNLNSGEGKTRLADSDTSDLNDVTFLQFERLNGDDASCLNLNQAQRPQILGVNPAVFDSAKAFSFVKLLSGIPRENPWRGLGQSFNDSTFPAYADQTVIQYSLKKKLGDTLVYLGESGKKFRLVLAGAINNSVFQGNILIADKVLRSQFPSSGGSRTMLVDAPAGKQLEVTELLSQNLMDYGIEITPTNQRLATFNSVENTYLTVFMALSGLGFIIGTIGLGIILLRNVYERKQELALMLSMGYSQKQVFKIVFTENFFLLVTGFLYGLLAALVGILPSLLSPAFNVQGGFLAILTAGIFISGLLWIYFPLRAALKKPLIEALRKE
jgi:ABC-type antimicrobial peptide transport system permease subunit